jgi:hypothetical protein
MLSTFYLKLLQAKKLLRKQIQIIAMVDLFWETRLKIITAVNELVDNCPILLSVQQLLGSSQD